MKAKTGGTGNPKKKKKTGGKSSAQAPTRHTKRGGKTAAGSGRRPTTADQRVEYLLRREEIRSMVMKYHCKGYNATEIAEALAKRYPGMRPKVSREDPYKMVQAVAKKGHLHYRAPHDEELRDRIMSKFRRRVEVVNTSTVQDVAVHTAEQLGQLVRQLHRERGIEEVHIGFAGGHSMRAVARCFADDLSRHGEDLPEALVFHSLAAGFDPKDPTTDPNAFFTYFLNEPVMQTKVEFRGLRAPSIVTPDHFVALKELQDIKRAFEEVKDIHIFVTSGTDWSDEHSALLRRMKPSDQAMQALKKAGCIGDILWRPIGASGPITAETEVRALTLVELGDLSGHIRDGKHVLLMLAPCGGCNTPKGALLKCILEQPQPLVTHVVVDSRTASQVLRIENGGKGS